MSGWTVRVNQTTNSTTAQSDATELRTLGFADSGVVNGNDFSSLCDGQFIVFSGFFGTQAEAQDRLDQILAKQPNFNGMQATQVANTSSATNCNPTR
jgi:hypothetical protein